MLNFFLFLQSGEPQIVAATDEEVNMGQQVFLSCTADAVPEPQMNLSSSDFPGLRVSVRPLEQNQHQAVVKVKPETSGTFEFLCTTRNEHGFDMKKLTLTVV
ncbi:multiple epidermal growth factor-like domains protein 10, partial [Nephila pilipes]